MNVALGHCCTQAANVSSFVAVLRPCQKYRTALQTELGVRYWNGFFHVRRTEE